MTRAPRPDLTSAVRAAGFTPRRDEAPDVVALLGDADAGDLVPHIARALGQLGDAGLDALRPALASGAPARRTLALRVAGRLGDALAADVAAALADPDPTIRRAAIQVAGRMGAALEEPLLARLDAAAGLPAEQAAIVEALGKIGGAAAATRLADLAATSPSVERALAAARLRVGRTLRRDLASAIDDTRVLTPAPPAELSCRAGLESILAESLEPAWQARILAPGRVGIRLAGRLAALAQARTWLDLELPLAPIAATPEPAVALGRFLASAQVWDLLRPLTIGAVRYRIEWVGQGPRRAATQRAALVAAELRPELENDPVQSTWEVRVRDRGSKLAVALVPRRLADERFAWRVADVPAASHPTVAAALARVGGVDPRDIVWDPFVGSAGELVERALAGSYAELWGTDRDPLALEAARANLAAAGHSAGLLEGDFRRAHPPRASLILTNPPMGHRVHHDAPLDPLFDDLVGLAGRLLVPGGRLVLLSPRPEATLAAARRAGLAPARRQRVDLGGIITELQRLERRA